MAETTNADTIILIKINSNWHRRMEFSVLRDTQSQHRGLDSSGNKLPKVVTPLVSDPQSIQKYFLKCIHQSIMVQFFRRVGGTPPGRAYRWKNSLPFVGTDSAIDSQHESIT